MAAARAAVMEKEGAARLPLPVHSIYNAGAGRSIAEDDGFDIQRFACRAERRNVVPRRRMDVVA